jgi:hypothetical protein
MPWIESHTVLPRHRKTLQLALKLKIPPVNAVGHLHFLWYTTLEQQEDGDLSNWSDEMIAHAAAYTGDASAFVAALQAQKLLDGKVVHDWLNYAGRYLTNKYKTSNPGKLKAIYKIHSVRLKSDSSPTKVCLQSAHLTIPNLTVPNQPNIPNQREDAAPLPAHKLSDDVWLKELRESPAYQHINFEVQLAKMDHWLKLPANKGRRKTRKFILNWLNRVEAPVVTHKQSINDKDFTKGVW